MYGSELWLNARTDIYCAFLHLILADEALGRGCALPRYADRLTRPTEKCLYDIR